MDDDIIRDLYKQDYTVSQIADLLGLCRSTVLNALNN